MSGWILRLLDILLMAKYASFMSAISLGNTPLEEVYTKFLTDLSLHKIA